MTVLLIRIPVVRMIGESRERLSEKDYAEFYDVEQKRLNSALVTGYSIIAQGDVTTDLFSARYFILFKNDEVTADTQV